MSPLTRTHAALAERWPALRIDVAVVNADGGLWQTSTHAGAARFLLYSVTKPILAALVLRMADAGRLDLDTPISSTLPGCPFQGTPRQLLRHTSGLGDYGGLPAYHAAVRATPGAPWSFDTLLADAIARPVFAPGTGWGYSNLGYRLLMRALESHAPDRHDPDRQADRHAPDRDTPAHHTPAHHTPDRHAPDRHTPDRHTPDRHADRHTPDRHADRHTPFAEHLTQLATLLGLHDTHAATRREDLLPLAPGWSRAVGAVDGDAIDGTVDVRGRYHPGWVAHGVVSSTARDIASFMHAFVNGAIVPGSGRALLEHVPVAVTHPCFVAPSYALGLMCDPAAARGPTFGHTGGGPGYAAAVYTANPGPRATTVAVLANAEVSDAIEAFALALLDDAG